MILFGEFRQFWLRFERISATSATSAGFRRNWSIPWRSRQTASPAQHPRWFADQASQTDPKDRPHTELGARQMSVPRTWLRATQHERRGERRVSKCGLASFVETLLKHPIRRVSHATSRIRLMLGRRSRPTWARIGSLIAVAGEGPEVGRTEGKGREGKGGEGSRVRPRSRL